MSPTPEDIAQDAHTKCEQKNETDADAIKCKKDFKDEFNDQMAMDGDDPFVDEFNKEMNQLIHQS